MGLEALAAHLVQCGFAQHVAWNIGAQVFPKKGSVMGYNACSKHLCQTSRSPAGDETL